MPSGDQAGQKPVSETWRTSSPVRPITNRPPPARDERKAIWVPSGEKAGLAAAGAGVAGEIQRAFAADGLQIQAARPVDRAAVHDPLPVG